IEPIRLVFCGSTRHVYDAIVEEIAPQSDGTCQVTAKEYLESFYLRRRHIPRRRRVIPHNNP
ncbi:hypothetical protein, partial [Klebsiella pneumoniae]